MATGSVTLDLDAIAAGAAPLGWTVGGKSADVLRLIRLADRSWVTVERDGWIAMDANWAVVGPLYRIIEQHKTEG